MSVRTAVLLPLSFVILLAPAGCRRNPFVDTYIEAMNAEFRALEDQYFDLQADYEVKLAELEALRRQRDGDSAASSRMPELPLERPVRPPDLTDDETGPLRPPVIEQGTPDPDPIPQPDRSGILPPPRSLRNAKVSSTSAAARTRRSASPVDKIVVHPVMAPSDGPSDASLDTGLALVIEPRDKTGAFVARPGKLTIVALDPRVEGDDARLARWDVSAVDAARAMSNSEGRPGIHLKLRWPEQTPRIDHVRVLVRYDTADGRRLEVNREVRTAPPSEASAEASAQWTRRASNGTFASRTPALPGGSPTPARSAFPAESPSSPDSAEPPPSASRVARSERPSSPSASRNGPATNPAPANPAPTNNPPREGGLPPVAPSWSPIR